MERVKDRKIVLEDGTEFWGTGFGADEQRMVEVVFNTSMVGYQEILSDPSYTDQAVVMTYPLIGNYGMCDEDYETEVPSISGLITGEYCDSPSNYRCTHTLGEIMKQYGVVGISGVDTRELARHIRDHGSCKACIAERSRKTEEILRELRSWIPPRDAVSRVSTGETYEVSGETTPVFHVVAVDCGMKKNIVRDLVKRGCRVTVVPWNTTAEEIAAHKPDGVFISNGPGDPMDVQQTITAIRELIGRVPIFGICLGHQIISLAYGAMTYKLKFGHRGGNHPVKNLLTDKIEITSQNHSYAVDEKSLPGTGLTATHINLLDNTVEGVASEKDFVFSVQYHPESAPGPQDSGYLFDRFLDNMKQWKEI